MRRRNGAGVAGSGMTTDQGFLLAVLGIAMALFLWGR